MDKMSVGLCELSLLIPELILIPLWHFVDMWPTCQTWISELNVWLTGEIYSFSVSCYFCTTLSGSIWFSCLWDVFGSFFRWRTNGFINGVKWQWSYQLGQVLKSWNIETPVNMSHLIQTVKICYLEMLNNMLNTAWCFDCSLALRQLPCVDFSFHVQISGLLDCVPRAQQCPKKVKYFIDRYKWSPNYAN